MPVTLMRFAIDIAQTHQDRERKLIGQSNVIGGVLGDILDDLDSDLTGYANTVADEIFRNGKIDQVLWMAKRTDLMSRRLNRPFNQFVRDIDKASEAIQREAFYYNMREHRKLFKELYPAQETTVSEKTFRNYLDMLQFQDAEQEIKFLRGQPVIDDSDLEEPINIESIFAVDSEIEIDVSEARTLPVGLNIGTGKLNQDFKMFLERQLQVGLDPANLIRTFSTEHIARMQRVLMTHVQKGLDITQARNKFVKGLVTDMTTGEEKRRLSYNAMRILRTAHGRAAASSVSLFGLQNRDMVVGLRRVADGRPCIACAFLDGALLPNGSTLNSHPQCMCVLVPIVKSLSELGFDPSLVPERHRAAFIRRQITYQNMRSRLYQMSEKEQRRIFSNDALYALWQQEQMPLGALVKNRNGMFVPKTAKEVRDQLSKLGGISNPKADFLKNKTRLNKMLDPMDRAKSGLVVVLEEDLPQKIKNKSPKFREDNKILSGLDEEEQERLIAKYPNLNNWHDLNDFRRDMGSYRRLATDGKTEYFAMPVAEYNLLLK